MKKGAGEGVLFSRATHNGIGDPFKEAALNMVRKENRQYQIEVGNEKAFRPTKHVRQPTNSAYPHMKDYEHVQKQCRDPETKEVYTMPRNIQTNPAKMGKVGKNTSFGGIINYMEDDYNRPKKIATEERLHGYSLMQEKPFSQKAKQTELFNSNRAVIGEDVTIPHRPPRQKTPPAMEHDRPFKPSNPPKLGYNKSLSPFPKYKEDPLQFVTRRMDEPEDDRKKFRPTHNSKSRP